MTPYIEIANCYFHDCDDFLHRYRLTFHDFTSMKSKRFKLFIDLRMAFECVLKANVVYFQMKELSRKEIIDKAQSLGHETSKLIDLVSGTMAQTQLEQIRLFSEELRGLPVALRYSLDQMDFRDAKEDMYYQTVGSDIWLQRLHDITTELSDLISRNLQAHSTVVSVKDMMNDVLTPKYNKTLNRNL